MGYFTIKNKMDLDEVQIGTRVDESDFSILTKNGQFVQMSYTDEEESSLSYDVSPGIWTIEKKGMSLVLNRTSFVRDEILSSFVHTKDITDKIDRFFKKLDVYAKFGIEVPKRGILLYGPPGSGKTTVINKVAELYSNDSKTAVIVWTTDKYDAYDVKTFIKSFNYINGVEKIILVVEDIGGVEIDQVKMKSDSSLLSLLDNQEKTFRIPTLILATTNFPEVFLGNLTNRPQRFDDKIEVGYPSGEHRAKLLQFFAKDEPLSSEAIKLISHDKCKEFSPAHIKECIIRSAIYDKTLEQTILEIREEIENYKKNFSKQNKIGMGLSFE